MISAKTHIFHRKTIDNHDASLYASVRFAHGNLEGIDNTRLRSMIADYIRKNENLQRLVLERNTSCQNIKDYCNKIEKGNIQDDELEFRALAMLCYLRIRVFSITKTSENNITINVLNYGEHVESFTECIYILYDEERKHYEPLYAINKQIPDENIKIFKCDDETIVQLVYRFIQEEFHYDANTQSDCNNLGNISEQPAETNVLNETERMFDLVTSSSSTNLYNKRKSPVYDTFLRTSTTEQASSSISHQTYVSNKRTKSSRLDNNSEKSSLNKNNNKSLTIEQHLQMDTMTDESGTDENMKIFLLTIKVILDSSNDKQRIENGQMPLNDEIEVEKMRFEIEPAPKFRGRTLTDFQPKKAQKRNGKPSTPRPPRYYPDRSRHRYLNLLIPEAYILPDIIQYCFEICIITREMNGYTYIHPYFKFQVHPTDPKSPILNPRYIYFVSTMKFKAYSEILRQLKLQLVVVMHTNKELMQSEQPLQIFSSSKNNDHRNVITTKFNDHRAFKDAYHLHDLCFAITLWSKKSGEKVFHRHNDKQYISQIVTEDKNTKDRKKKDINIIAIY
ncbi:unnamed protein product [Rotaria sp. Silwood2]|nr:unnamed protein product [Rotaria sp. Silwood2]